MEDQVDSENMEVDTSCGCVRKEKKWQPQVVMRESVIEPNFKNLHDG